MNGPSSRHSAADLSYRPAYARTAENLAADFSRLLSGGGGQSGEAQRLIWLVNQGVTLDWRIGNGAIPLPHYLCRWDSPELLWLIAEKKPDLFKKKTIAGDSFLHALLKCPAKNILSDVLEGKAPAFVLEDINSKNTAGQTPLMVAIMCEKDVEVIRRLVAKGARISDTDAAGASVSQYAETYAHLDAVNFFKTLATQDLANGMPLRAPVSTKKIAFKGGTP